MSLRALLTHRADVLRMTDTDVDGAVVYSWSTVATDQACYLDLTYLRRGKDPMWSPEAGRATDRTGVFFCRPDSVLKPGDRVVVRTRQGTKLGTFLVEGAMDVVIGRRGEPHHIEVGVSEVAAPLGRS